jgi:transcriptional regulator with XRE-family HTH domain
VSAVVEIRRYQSIEVKDLGKKLKAAREKDTRSVQVLATLAGISMGYWYQIENEERKWISEEIVRSIESVLGVDFGVKFDD